MSALENYGTTGCCLLLGNTQLLCLLYELDPEVMHLSLRNKQKAAQLHNFSENCKFATAKLRYQQFLNQILFSTAESSSLCDTHRISGKKMFTVSSTGDKGTIPFKSTASTWLSVRYCLKGTNPV